MNLTFQSPCFPNQCHPAVFMEKQIRQSLAVLSLLQVQQVISRLLCFCLLYTSIQAEYRYLPGELLTYVAKEIGVKEAKAYSVATVSYTHL